MLSPVFLRAISTRGCCRLQFFSIDILPPPITVTRLSPGEEKLINTRESCSPALLQNVCGIHPAQHFTPIHHAVLVRMRRKRGKNGPKLCD